MDWKLSIAGLAIGLLVGVTGMGGGSLMTPLLVLLFGFKPTVAIGTDIVHGAIFKSFGAVQHRRLELLLCGRGGTAVSDGDLRPAIAVAAIGHAQRVEDALLQELAV